MTARRTLWRVVALALVCIAGIVGMLLSESAWDWVFFAMSALPLLVGGRAWATARRATGSR